MPELGARAFPPHPRHTRLVSVISPLLLSFPHACGGNPSALLFGWLPATYRGEDGGGAGMTE
jgi:hypothetical protein